MDLWILNELMLLFKGRKILCYLIGTLYTDRIPLADGRESLQGGIGRRQDCVQTSGHPVQQHVGTESLQVSVSI